MPSDCVPLITIIIDLPAIGGQMGRGSKWILYVLILEKEEPEYPEKNPQIWCEARGDRLRHMEKHV